MTTSWTISSRPTRRHTPAVHDSRYPTPEYIKSVTKVGNIYFQGDYSYDSDGSQLIKKVLLDDEPGPVFVQAWGGASSIAAALRSTRMGFHI